MNLYMAPMEGITTYIYRSAFKKYYGGFDKYFTPFMNSAHLSAREKRDVAPQNNYGLHVIPQILSNDSDIFISIAEELSRNGYSEVNLNLGCPSKTVVSKGRGSGALSDIERLKHFLDNIFAGCPLKISVKTRLGADINAPDFENLISVFRQYPFTELIIHPRFGNEFYRGKVHIDEFFKAADEISEFPVIYNGDIKSVNDFDELISKSNEHKTVNGYKNSCISHDSALMIGRGAISNPYLPSEFKDFQIPPHDIIRSTFRNFHNELISRYTEEMSGETPVAEKMKELWFYWAECEDSIFFKTVTDEKNSAAMLRLYKEIKKSHHMDEYKSSSSALISLI